MQCLENDGTNGTAIMNDFRRRLDERALEKEEDYFTEGRYVSSFTSVKEILYNWHEISGLLVV